jgi:hypothetical protein
MGSKKLKFLSPDKYNMCYIYFTFFYPLNIKANHESC